MKTCQLTARKIAAAKAPGYYGDGGGLYLQVTKGQDRVSQSWVFRFRRAERAREMGLGSFNTFSLAEARERARTCRQQVADGLDPIELRKTKRDGAAAKDAKRVTFKEAAERYIKSHEKAWKNPKHRQQWSNTLETYAYPVMGRLPVDAIELPHILRVLEPIWYTKTETASRLRGRVERILAWAIVREYRWGDNPARWSGHLSETLPSKHSIAKAKHHAALPFTELPEFMGELRPVGHVSARALEFTILTAARTTETIEAEWSEFNLDAATWTIPAERMKSDRPHCVPLSKRAVAILEALPGESSSRYVFPGGIKGRPLSTAAMDQYLKGRGYGSDVATVHGFRSTFRDWAGDRTPYPRDVIELALAHVIKDKAEAAYRRGSALEKRRKLMDAWSSYCEKPTGSGKVVQFRGAV
jgi:integrase